LFGLLGIEFGNGWLGYLVAGFIGACVLIWIARWARADRLIRRLGGCSSPYGDGLIKGNGHEEDIGPGRCRGLVVGPGLRAVRQ
jgi:hypothetical protein